MNAIAAAAQSLINWITAHPYQAFLHVVNGVVLLTPAAATVPLFSVLGFSAGGPVAGQRLHSFFINLATLDYFSIVLLLPSDRLTHQ